MPSRGLIAEARRPYVDRTHDNEADALAMAYSNEDDESAPPTPTHGARDWRSPVAPIAGDSGSLGSVRANAAGATNPSKNATAEVEHTPQELLQGMVATQMDAGLGQVSLGN